MPAMKSEETIPRVPVQLNLSSSSYTSHYSRQYDLLDRNLRAYATVPGPYATNHHREQNHEDRNHYQSRQSGQSIYGPHQQPRPEFHTGESVSAHHQCPSSLSQAIRHADHDILYRVENQTYLKALRDLAEARKEAAEYRQQAIQLSAKLDTLGKDYSRLAERFRVIMVQPSQRIQQSRGEEERAVQTLPDPLQEPQSTTTEATPRYVTQDSKHGRTSQTGESQPRTSTATSEPASTTRPSGLPNEVFWKKSDWLGKGYSNGTFVRDSNGNYLKSLLRDIRNTTRRIWTELEDNGCAIHKSFNKNNNTFLDTYVATIEEEYPCLKLCDRHWKALQIGSRAYPHWYATRNKRRAGTGTTTHAAMTV